MQLTREDFQKFLYTYNEDELFYRTLYFEKKEHPETFHKFCLNLDCDLISRRQLYVPELQKEGWHSYFEEKAMFCDTADNIMLYKHYRYTPEFIHEHEFFEILCIYDGQAHTSIQGIEHTLHKGDVCIIPPHTKHSIGIFDDSIAFNILIRGSTFQSTFFQSLTEDSALAHFFAHVLYRKTEGNYLIFHTANDPQIREMLENLYIEYLGHEKYSYTFLNSMLILLWAMLLRYHGGNIESILAKDTSGNSMTDILNYLSQHYQTATLRETASHFGYSSSHFSTLIKEGTGQTFLQIIRSIKLEQACRALRETSLSNIAICELVGYDSPEHFMRTFKKNYGMTPGEYRRKYKEKKSDFLSLQSH